MLYLTGLRILMVKHSERNEVAFSRELFQESLFWIGG